MTKTLRELLEEAIELIDDAYDDWVETDRKGSLWLVEAKDFLKSLPPDAKPQRYNVGADGCPWEDDRGTYVRYEDVAQLLGDDSGG